MATIITDPKRPNWTPYAIAAIACLVLGMFFFIDADAARHSAKTGKTWEVLAWIFLVLFVGSIVTGAILTNRKRKL